MIKDAALSLALAMIAGCSSLSPGVDSTPAAASAAAPVAAPDAAVAAANVPASTTMAANDGPPPGWQEKKRVGETVYCRKLKVTGSRYPQEECLRPDEVDAALQAQKTQMEQRTRPMSESIEIQD
ncbi:MAG TPA: hypothetical protein VFP48_07025 [Steroidobacteraceae bacterium]|nr:hypothetical protein [Steroidobacteraceae bacterium]